MPGDGGEVPVHTGEVPVHTGEDPVDTGEDPVDDGVSETPPHRRQRIGAYGIVRDPDGRLLLVRAASYLTVAGRWFLPGGGVEHGEDPLDSLRREVHEETGLAIGAATLLGVLSDTWPIPDGSLLHSIRLCYRVDSWRGTLRPEVSGSSDAAEWFAPGELGDVRLARYAREALARFADAPASPGTGAHRPR